MSMQATSENTHAGPSKVLLASPRGYCAGVDRAVQTVEHALDLYGEPIYVRKEIVHNKHVVHELEKRGAIFVEEEREVPEGEMVVFSAHGVAPSVHANAAIRHLRTIDATCPLVTKVHVEARKFAADGYTIVLIGSTNSSNSNRLVEVAREHGAASYLIDNHLQVDEAWLEGIDTVGITSGASAPEELVERLVSFFRDRGATDVGELKTVDEDVRFMLPGEIRKELAT